MYKKAGGSTPQVSSDIGLPPAHVKATGCCWQANSASLEHNWCKVWILMGQLCAREGNPEIREPVTQKWCQRVLWWCQPGNWGYPFGNIVSSKGKQEMKLSLMVLTVSSVKYTRFPLSMGFLLLTAGRSKESNLKSNRVIGCGLKADGNTSNCDST